MLRMYALRSGWCLIGLLLLAACHDAPRKNPFDPALTPEVEVTRRALDEKEGTVFLEWTQYSGAQPFKEYRILRKVQGFEAVDTVAFISEVEQTHFTDTDIEPDMDYLYRVAVVNQWGFAVESPEVSVGSFGVNGVDLLETRSDDVRGSISLRWERYAGPDFENYEVWRRSSGQEN